MSLNETLTRMWSACNHGTPSKNFWEEDTKDCTPGNGWEALDEKVAEKAIDCEMVDQVVSSCGVFLSHFRFKMEVPSIVGMREQAQDYYEITAVAYAAATRWEPEDADPYLISGHFNNLHGAFLAFLSAEMDFRLTGWAESQQEHDWDVATGGEGGLGVC